MFDLTMTTPPPPRQDHHLLSILRQRRVTLLRLLGGDIWCDEVSGGGRLGGLATVWLIASQSL